MQRILRKRIFRDLKANFLRYLALGILIILGMYIVISLVAAAETIIKGTQKAAVAHKVEDGQFCVFEPLSDKEETALKEMGITLEETFYLDFAQEDGSTIRVYKNREKINLPALDEGYLAENAKELVLEKRYAEEHELKLGDNIMISGTDFEIVGLGSVPDYEAPLKKFSDSAADSGSFGIAFMEEAAYKNLKAGNKGQQSESYYYSYLLNDKITDDELKNLIDTNNLTIFLKAGDNPRIGAARDDQVISRLCGLIAGVIVMILFTYVISVFVIHGIEKECSVIGTLYALGVRKRDLISHYLTLPVLVTFLGAVIGTMLGFSEYGVSMQMRECYQYFSIPMPDIIHPAYLIVYSIVMPPVVAVLVNYFVIRKHLSRTALSMIRNEQKQSFGDNMNLGNLGFVKRFQIRQMMREVRTGFTVVFGMFISLLIMMLGINCAVLLTHLSEETKEDTGFEYMYTYKYQDKEVPKGGTEAFAYSMKREMYGYNLEVTLLGITEDNPYFDVKAEKGENKVVLASATAQKYQLEVGDEIILTDEEKDRDYTFRITDIAQYASGLYVFMDIDSMCSLFEKDKDYYNVVFSDHELDISPERLYAITTRDEIIRASDIFVSKMKPMVMMLCTAAVFIFCVVMYLMMKVMIDRSAFSISIMKIFGYRAKEIRRLYLNGNLFIVAAGALVGIPLAKTTIDAIYPLIISNVACGMNLTFSLWLYVGIFVAVVLLYFIINPMMMHRVKNIVPAEVLKNRE